MLRQTVGLLQGVVRELAEDELASAQDALGADIAADFKVISGRSVPSALALEVERCGVDPVVVPIDGGKVAARPPASAAVALAAVHLAPD